MISKTSYGMLLSSCRTHYLDNTFTKERRHTSEFLELELKCSIRSSILFLLS